MKISTFRCIPGFSFIELIVVLAVLSVLSFLALPLYEMGEIRAREKELREALRETRQGIDRYRAERNSTDCPYPPSIASLTEPIPDSLLRPGGFSGPFISNLPRHSFTGRGAIFLWDVRDSSGIWQFGVENASQSFAPNGVFDLRVPTTRMGDWFKAIDGSLYADW